MYIFFCVPNCVDLDKDWESSDQTVNAGTKVLVVNAVLSRIHVDQRISDDIFHEWTNVNLAKDEAEGVCCRITKHHEFVA